MLMFLDKFDDLIKKILIWEVKSLKVYLCWWKNCMIGKFD